jgi:hypothetical protein
MIPPGQDLLASPVQRNNGCRHAQLRRRASGAWLLSGRGVAYTSYSSFAAKRSFGAYRGSGLMRHFAKQTIVAALGAVVGRARLDHELALRDEMRTLRRIRLAHTEQVTQPLVLISQVQRMGGSLLSQLFDGHPQLHCHAGELHIARGGKDTWPELDLKDGPDQWFEILHEHPPWKDFLRGYSKTKDDPKKTTDVYPFLFLPELQRAIFRHCIDQGMPKSDRDIMNAYMTSYFNAWLDNQNLYGAEKRAITAFAATMIMGDGSVDRFFSTYPDGWLISIIREPKSWYAAASKYKQQDFGNLEQSMAKWRRSVEAGIYASQRPGARTRLIAFEDLVARPRDVMSGLAEWIGIDFSPSLLVPTFNGKSIKANSAFPIDRAGVVVREPLTRAALLDEATAAAVEAAVGDLYVSARKHLVAF